MTPDQLPSYDDLPAGPSGGRVAWGLFGPDDDLGMANLFTLASVAAAASLVTTGEVFALNAALDGFDPPLTPSRKPVRHSRAKVQREAMIGFDASGSMSGNGWGDGSDTKAT